MNTMDMPQFPKLFTIFNIIFTIVKIRTVTSCEFPEALRMEPDDPPWLSHVKEGPPVAKDATSGGAGSLPVPRHDAEYYIRRTVLEIHYPGVPGRTHVRWKCSLAYHGKLLLKRQDNYNNNFYRCARFHFRSQSLVQIAWSKEVKKFDLGLCTEEALIPDPWLLLRAETYLADHSKCPISGGFDMKVKDSEDGENGCNLMLRPMRLEVECVGGDGVIFDYISSDCLPNIRMFFRQRTLCVASWADRDNHYVVLRRNEDTDLWCLVVPVDYSERGKRDSGFKAYLYNDLSCWPKPQGLSDPASSSAMPFQLPKEDTGRSKYFTLSLRTRVYSSLCEDEYDACVDTSCNLYSEKECRRSCSVCSPETAHPPTCEYPRRLQGSWHLQDVNGGRDVTISDTNVSISSVGSFQCVTYPNGPERKSRIFTTVSIYNNGCRPRFSCLKLLRLGPAVLSYSLSHSFIWPEPESDPGEQICAEDRFYPDPSPLDDLYRSDQGSGKPVVARTVTAQQRVHCNISAVLTLSATLPEGYTCMGTLARHCQDPTKLRLQFSSCGSLVPASTDYECLANFHGNSWETIVLVQNVYDSRDTRCLVFNKFYPNEAYSLVAGQCDKQAFNYARSKLRIPLLKLEYRSETEECQTVPTSRQPVETTPVSSATSPSQNSFHNSHGSMGDESRSDDKIDGYQQGVDSNPASIVVDGDSSSVGKSSGPGYRDKHTPNARPTSLEAGDRTMKSTNDNNSCCSASPNKALTIVIICVFSVTKFSWR